MLQVNWIIEPGVIGARPNSACLQKCEQLASLLPLTDQLRYLDNCKNECAAAPSTTPSGGGGTTTTTTAAPKKSSNTGLIVAGVVAGAIALAVIASS